MVKGWYFAPSYGGQTSGINDPGISHFSPDPIRSIAKETLQDSIDAAYPTGNQVIVRFRKFNVKKDEIPDYKNLLTSFESGVDYWSHHKEAKSFFQKGLQELKNETISILAIEDYQTTGLSKVGDSKTGGWYSLVSSSGVTEKKPTDGGSYGFGKYAPFSASNIRTVFYSTKNLEDEFGFQGVTRIPTILAENQETQGIGYYFNKVKREPVKCLSEVPYQFRRNEYGTSKFIIAFSDEENWKKRIIDEVISNYLIAIDRGKLVVHIEDIVINKKNLPNIIDIIKDFNENSLALQYYKVLTSSRTKEYTEEFVTDKNTTEKITLKILVEEGFKKRVGLHRSTGMKIYDKGHFRVPLDFSGVLVVEGDRLNAIFREMEPPTHDAWIPRYFTENPNYAKRLLKSVYKWLNECARSLLSSHSRKKIKIQGASNILPNISEEDRKAVLINEFSKKDNITNFRFNQKNRRRRSEPITPTQAGSKGKSKQEPDNGKDNSRNTKSSSSKGRISKINIFCLNPAKNIYTIFYQPDRSGTLELEIKAIGENGRSFPIKLESVKMGNDKIPFNKNVLGPIDIDKENFKPIQMSVSSSTRLALEVIQK